MGKYPLVPSRYEREPDSEPGAFVVVGKIIAHLSALLIVVGFAGICWTLFYFGLLAWAVLVGGGIGGPLAYPAGLGFFAVLALASCLLFLMPSTVFATWWRHRYSGSLPVQIVIAVTILAVLCLIASLLAFVGGRFETPQSVAIAFAFLFLMQLIPLGIYWWVTQAGVVLTRLVKNLVYGAR